MKKIYRVTEDVKFKDGSVLEKGNFVELCYDTVDGDIMLVKENGEPIYEDEELEEVIYYDWHPSEGPSPWSDKLEFYKEL